MSLNNKAFLDSDFWSCKYWKENLKFKRGCEEMLITQRKEKKRLGEILIEQGLITEAQLSEMLAKQKETNLKLGELIINNGIITEKEMLMALSKQTKCEYIDLDTIEIDIEAINAMNDIEFLKKNKVYPFKLKDGWLHVAINDPLNDKAIEDMKIISKYPIIFHLATIKSISLSLDKAYGQASQQFLIKQYSAERKLDNVDEEENTEIDEQDPDSSIVRIINQCIEQAVHFRASDIHIEAMESRIRIRYRIDGDLKEFNSYPSVMLGSIISRIKIMADMDISEKRKPQDGRITYIVDKTEYDIRVSALPTSFGEKVVMRLAEKKSLRREMSGLGFDDSDLTKFKSIISNPHGIILVTGPTGSGKSTTLYTALSELNKEKVNIITVEDPVEADIDGINQVHVNAKAGLTFASALRSILRQDPDIIMIGEIRDKETADIAVEASLTGHLVVSTLHTNSAISTITRLENMGVADYLLADATVGIIAQRLIKRLCECKQVYTATDKEKEQLRIKPEAPLKLYKPCGCALCNNTGYKGRIGVYEILPISKKMRYKIAEGAKAEELEKIALQEGMRTLAMSARRIVVKGISDISEFLRIAHDN